MIEKNGAEFADCTEVSCDLCGLPPYECCEHCPHDENWTEGA